MKNVDPRVQQSSKITRVNTKPNTPHTHTTLQGNVTNTGEQVALFDNLAD